MTTKNGLPSRKCQKYLIARCTASSLRSNVLYLVSVGDNFQEKWARGDQTEWIRCCKTAPTVLSEASVIRQVGASA